MNASTSHTHEIVRQLQNNLYQSAKKDNRRFFALYDKVYRREVLEEAWIRVKTGEDEEKINDITLKNVEAYGTEKLLEEIRIELQQGRFKLGPDKRIFLGNADRKKTPIELSKLKDQIIQTAVKIVIEPIFEADFVNSNNDFNSKQSRKWAFDEVNRTFKDTDYDIVETHINACMDNINKKKLMKLVEKSISDRRVLELIRQGIGGKTLAPLLMNIYLNVLDVLWKKHGIAYGNLVRYAEDIIIICNDEKSANHAYKLLKNIVRKLDLELDPEKTRMNQKPVTEDSSTEVDNEVDQCPSKNCIHEEEQASEGQNVQKERNVQEERILQEARIVQEEQDLQEYPVQQEHQLTEEQEPQVDEKVSVEQNIKKSSGCFCGYKYRFGLNASHSGLSNHIENEHYHNFTITLYINSEDGRLDDNYKVEQAVQEWLKPLQGKQLEKEELFLGRETTVEGMAETFFDPLYDLIDTMGFELVKLSLYDNPIRVYSVSNKRLDSTVNEISNIPLECIPIILLDDRRVNSEMEQINQPAIEPENKPEAQTKAKTLSNLDNSPDQETGQLQELLPVNNYSVADPVQDTLAATVSPDIDGIDKSKDKKKTNPFLRILSVMIKLLIGSACFAALAVITMYVIKESGIYPQGSDTFCHLYRADLILKNIQQGNWFPLYDNKWYNGVEIMRYWGPLPLYIIAGVEWLIQSNILDAYIVFLGVLILIGGCGWLLWGITYKRTSLSIVIGLIWFYFPENMRVVIKEGNLPRGVINALLPFYFYFFWKVMAEKKRKALVPLIAVTVLITLCHLGITLMLIVSVVIYALIYAKSNHSLKTSLCALGASLSGVLLAGLWVVPALIGGAASGSSTNQVMKFFFENALISLNPFTRINGDVLSFYFGLSIFFICLLGIFFGTKKITPGFTTAAVLFLCTTKSVYSLFSKLPFSQFLWMIRFIPIALAVAMVSFLLWKQLRKWTVILLCIFLIADCATSALYIYYPKEQQIENVQASLNERAENMLLMKAKEITNQRLAVMDLSKYGSFAPYYVSGVGKKVNYAFGAGWEGAKTASNIVNLNASVENGWYVYLFDRALELGNDTVLIPIDNLKSKSNDVNEVIFCAKLRDYNLVGRNTSSLLFHKDTEKQFGVITNYENLAIGSSVSCIAMIFPSFEEGTKSNINDYTYEELKNYRTIYLSGITYNDKTAAENLLSKLAQNGVQIYIDMNRVPVVKAKKCMELFGVSAQDISFTDTYPKLVYQGQAYKSLDFTFDLGEWNTVYLDGLDHIQGNFKLTNKKLAFIGTANNKNLHFIGLNIVYYLQETRDSEVEKLVSSIFGMNQNDLPKRTVVPLQIETGKNKITIKSTRDNVNTTLSSIDIFHSTKGFRTNNNMVTVNTGTTEITLRYPHAAKGMIVTASGFILAILIFLTMQKKKEGGRNEKIQGN